MAGLAARESIVMSGEWMDSREGKACSSNTWEGGESAKRERGLWATRTTNYATPAFPDKHRHLFPPPTYPLKDLASLSLLVFCGIAIREIRGFCIKQNKKVTSR